TAPFSAAGSAAGVVLQIKGGPTLYHTGDTDVFGDMKLIGERFHPDVMLACIGGHFTMDPHGAALAATMVKPKVIVPRHYATFPVLTGTPEQLQSELKTAKSSAKLATMQVGETRTF